MSEYPGPRYVDEVEGLLQVPGFYDEQRAGALYNDFEALAGEELGERQIIYTAALRVIATARADERSMAKAAQKDAFDARDFNDQWTITTGRLQRITAEYASSVGVLARRLAMLNSAEQSIDENLGGTGYMWLYDHQRPYLTDIVGGLQKGPSEVDIPSWYTKTRERYSLPGILVQGPTGIGKTAIIARTAVSLGIGKPPIENAGHEEMQKPRSMLFVTSYQNLVGQLQGKQGNDTFQRLAPGVKVTAFYGREKNNMGDVVATTIETFEKDFSGGWFNGRYFDTLCIDEVHHLTEPQFLQAVVETWDGPTLGFSATPAYSEDKDAGTILKHNVHHGELRDYVDSGDLSNLVIYTGAVYPEDLEAADQEDLAIETMTVGELRYFRHKALALAVRDFILPLVVEGRRGLVFCEPGDDSYHARMIRDLLKKTKLPDGSTIRAEAKGTFQGASQSDKNSKITQDFDDGKLDGVVAVEMGREGLDLKEVNFVVVAARVTSKLKLQQIAGRGTRPSEMFPDTILAQFAAVGFGQTHYYDQTFLGVLGYEKVEQAATVRVRTDNAKTSSKPRPRPVFSDRLLNIFARTTTKELSRIFIADADVAQITEGYIPIHEIVAGTNITEHHARYQLLRAGYVFEGKMESKDGGRPLMVRYYEPNAKTYFTDNPKPPEVGNLSTKNLFSWANRDEITTLEEIADALSLDKRVLRMQYLTEAEKAASELRRTTGAVRVRAWPKDRAKEIEDRVRALLVIPAYIVTYQGVSELIDKDPDSLSANLNRKRAEFGVGKVVRGNRTFPGIGWRAIEKLEKRYGRKKGIPRIDYNRLPQGPDDTDPAREKYAREIQRLIYHASWLPPEPPDPAPPTSEPK